jgi:DNA-binding PadR family transcriptional regulator
VNDEHETRHEWSRRREHFGPHLVGRIAMAMGRGHHGRGGFPFGREERHVFRFGPGFGGGFGGPGFGRGPKVRRGDVRAAALALLAEGPRNGYQIIQEIGERSGGVWRPSPGSVYPALSQLEDEGLIRAEERDGRRQFVLTDEGRAYVESHKDELAAPWETVSDSVTDEMMELRSLVGQVAAAAMQVSHAGTPAQIAQARKILADTRKALYRILADGEPETL